MHSGTLERAGSPRKRTLSRGVSEDESLRNIIKEAESSTRRLTRSDSRGDTLKRRSESQRSDEDLVMTLPEMLELQTSYDEVVQELRGLEVERETLWFQVDVLQDALEGAEEMLAEAQREASHASMELERERETKRKLEDMVGSLMQEVERLKEHRNTIPAVPVYTLVREQEREEEVGRQQGQEGNNKMKKEAQKQISDAPKDEGDSAQAAPLAIVRLDSVPLESQRSGSLMETNAGGLLASFFRKGRGEQPSDGDAHPPPLHDSRLGSSVDSDDAVEGSGEGAEDEDGPLTKLQKMVSKTFGQKPTLALGSQPPGSQAEDGRDSSPDRNNDTDSISAYEDASADTPEMEGVFPGSASDGLEMPDDAGSPVDKDEEEYLSNTDQSIGNDPKSPDSCLLS